MGKTKFTVRVEPRALQAAKDYAQRHGTTVTSLVEEYFRSLSIVEQISPETPILNELAGSLGEKASLDDYRVYLEEKYLAGDREDE